MKRFRVTVNGVGYEVEVELLEDDEANPSPANRLERRELVSSAQSVLPRTPPPAPGPGERVDRKTVVSPMAGTVKKVNVKPGDTVKANDVLLVLEAMKMNSDIASPSGGRVRSVRIEVGATVQQGQVLVTFD